MPEQEHTYEMSLDLSVLKHLGLNLYSNLPAVISEVVANAWDADATEVSIDINTDTGVIEICDNGVGMARNEINDRYLKVGYSRRDDTDNPIGKVTFAGRKVMGRKGIGKLSLFSVANVVEVHSAAPRPLPERTSVPPASKTWLEELAGDATQKSAFRMSLDAINDVLADPTKNSYEPTAVDPDVGSLIHGTRLVLTEPRKNLKLATRHLRRRLARRFAIKENFTIAINGDDVTADDREYAKRARYLWVFGSDSYADEMTVLTGASRVERLPSTTPKGYEVEGWIGAAGSSTDLKPKDEQDESLNAVTILVRGKVAQENILSTVKNSGVFSNFLSGEINADYLDEDGMDDIATSSRQGIIEDAERFEELRNFVTIQLAKIGSDWNRFREEDGVKDAATLIPAITAWIDRFEGDDKSQARSFIGKVNSSAVPDGSKRQLLASAVVAFERLHRRRRLRSISEMDTSNIPALLSAFGNLDEVEEAMYYDIVKQRLEIVEKFQKLTEEDALEKVLQEYLFEHLWLLDPSWDRVDPPIMEKSISTILNDKSKTQDRIDIKYRITGTSHVLVELKKAERTVSTSELLAQIRKYRSPIIQELRNQIGPHVDLQIVCVVGRELSDWKDDGGREPSDAALGAYSAKVVTYNHLIRVAKESYAEYLRARTSVGELRAIVESIEGELAVAEPITDSPPSSDD